MTSPPSYVQRLFLNSLVTDLRAGRMRTVINGSVVAEDEARRLVAHARACGWIDIPNSPTDRSRTGCAPS
jgi:hypothetical protein